MPAYSLPDLSYDYGALEPHIAGEIMELHHSEHHATYVKGTNDTLERIAAARDKGDFGPIVGLEKTPAFNVGGRINHSIFWQNLSPDGGGKPQGELAANQVPVVILDMWEHAFYLQYKNVKPDYVKAWWNIINWDDAAARLDGARTAGRG